MTATWAVRPSTRARGVLSCAEGRRDAAVVARREHLAADTGDAEHVEERPLDVRADPQVPPDRRPTKVEPLGRPGERAVEQLGLAVLISSQIG